MPLTTDEQRPDACGRYLAASAGGHYPQRATLVSNGDADASPGIAGPLSVDLPATRAGETSGSQLQRTDGRKRRAAAGSGQPSGAPSRLHDGASSPHGRSLARDLAGGDDEPRAPARRAPPGGRAATRRHRCRCARSATAVTEFEFHISPASRLVAAPGERRHRGDEVEDPEREQRVGGEPLRAVDRLGDDRGSRRRASDAPRSGRSGAAAPTGCRPHPRGRRPARRGPPRGTGVISIANRPCGTGQRGPSGRGRSRRPALDRGDEPRRRGR